MIGPRGSPLKFKSNCGSGFPLLALGAIAAAAGVYHQNPLITALGAALLAVPAAVHALLCWSLRGISIERWAPESVFEGDTVEVQITLHNASRLPLFFPRVSEVFAPEVQAQKDVVFPRRVLPGETVEEIYRGSCLLPRGVYRLGPLALSLSDPLGWFQVARRVESLRPIKVYPRFQEFGVPEQVGERLSVTSPRLTRLGIGESNEFFSVREYRVGDPLRRVHWPLSAHRDYPVVREYARNSTGHLAIFLDLYRYALLGVGRGSSLEQSVKIAAALAAQALRRGHQVEVAGRMGSREVRLPPASGSSHLQAILDALVEVKPDGAVPLDEYLELRAREVRPGSVAVLMVSPYLRASRRFASALLALRRGGVRVILVLFDDATYRSLYEVPEKEPAIEAYELRMRSLGMQTVRVACAANLQAVFSQAAGGGRETDR